MSFNIRTLARLMFFCGLVIWLGLYQYYSPIIGGPPPEALESEKRGDNYFREGNPELAVEAWRQSIAFAPDRPDAYRKLSSYLMIVGELEEARSVLREAISYIPRDANLHFNLALACFVAGSYDEAEESFLEVSRLDSFYPEVHYLLGLVFRARGEHERARESFIRELNNNPGSRGAWKEVKEMGA